MRIALISATLSLHAAHSSLHAAVHSRNGTTTHHYPLHRQSAMRGTTSCISYVFVCLCSCTCIERICTRIPIHIRTAQQTLARNVHCPQNSLARAPDKSHASDCGPPIQVSLLFFFAPQCFRVSTFALLEQKTHACIRDGNAVRKYKHASGITFTCVSVVRSATVVVVVVVLVIVVTVCRQRGAFKTRQKEFYTGTCHPRCQSQSDGLPLTIHIHSSHNTTTSQYFTSTPLQAMCNRTTRRFIIILGKATNG